MFSKPRILGYFRGIEMDPQKELFSNVYLKVKRGETICIGGPSGQGKSALLRVIAGLTRPTRGNIYYFGEYLPPEKLTALEVAKRQVGMVFQNGALISNLRVRDNIAMPLRYHKMGTPAEIEEKVNMAMDLMRVREEADLFPHMLSMGMQKRVAIARSWAMDPKLLLMDEPTAGLDNYNRRNLLPLIDNMRTLFKTTIIIVTHDLMISKELDCNICFLHRKTLTEPKPFDYWLNTDSEISRELFRDLRNSG
ncbi:ABC transporter ATP-binding protein [Fibrobacter succinogenes]|uniref:ABC transporter ATP-binding protein n=1 Tax=Fibrobacter succinogenes TaxID=833 RepID=UPI0013D897A6|nr:ATP-binding cassette domain-containing protein [Fibrobacter succinogenes]MBO6076922.1 ATP-binding cassette domain-containing protein [Fibrobacter sp.]